MTIVTRAGSFTRLQPRALNTGIAREVESSLPMQRSTLALTISPALTLFLPEARARTFSVAVILIIRTIFPPSSAPPQAAATKPVSRGAERDGDPLPAADARGGDPEVSLAAPHLE